MLECVHRSRCYKSLDLMFSGSNADSLPPCAIQLIRTTLQSVMLTPEVLKTLMEDALVLNRNCWRIITQQASEEEDELIETLWLPIVTTVCDHCEGVEKENCCEILDVLRVRGGVRG